MSSESSRARSERYPLKEVLDPPSCIKTVLLPFEGKIIYDSFLESSGIRIGPEIRADLNNQYRLLKKQRAYAPLSKPTVNRHWSSFGQKEPSPLSAVQCLNRPFKLSL